jgi:hypothetical protein
MKGNIAYCGLACDACPIHWVSLKDVHDDKIRFKKAVSEAFKNFYGQELPWGDINDCHGCRAQTGKIFSWCTQCPVRKCAREREFTTCAECADYPCPELQNVFKLDPAARSRLEVLRAVSTDAAKRKPS